MKEPTAPKTVAGYYRVSLARDNMVAPELYEAEIHRYCTYKGVELADIYSDIDMSAFRGAKARPSLEELVKRRKEYSAVVVPKLSRFGRSMKELIRLFDVFDRDHIPLVFLDMNLDTSTSQGRLLRHILAAFAEYESDVKADYARANHRRIRAQGKPFGTPPFGLLRSASGEWVVEEERAALIRSIFRAYVKGNSTASIAEELHALGIKTKKGIDWKPQAVGRVLDNCAYAGLSLFEDEFVEARWPAIVPEAIWHAARQRRLADPRRRGNLGVSRPRFAYLLTGLVWCGQCGRRMTHTTSHRKTGNVYMCQRSWDGYKQCLNARVYDFLAHDFVRDAFLDRCVFTILTESGARAGTPRSIWDEATLPEQQRLLGLVIDRVYMSPLEEQIPRDRWPTTLRHSIDIQWKADAPQGQLAVVAESPPPHIPGRSLNMINGRAAAIRSRDLAALLAEETAAGATETPRARGLSDHPRRPDPSGKTWAQWTRELIEGGWHLVD